MILVRANYTNIQYGITETTEYLERFFRNLLMGEQNELKSVSTQESAQETSKSTQEMILDEIRTHPFTTRQQLAKVIGITPDGIKKQMEKLRKANLIKHVGPTKGGHWEIIK